MAWLWSAPTASAVDLTISQTGSSDRAIGVYLLARHTEGNNLVGKLQIDNLSGTWVYIEQDVTSTVSLPESVYLLGPGATKAFPDFVFPLGAHLTLSVTTPTGLDHSTTFEPKVLALENAFLIDLITRGLMSFSLPWDAFDRGVFGGLGAVSEDLFDALMSVNGYTAFVDALKNRDGPGLSSALVTIAADSKHVQSALVELLKHLVTKVQVKNALEGVAGIIDLPEKVRLLKELTDHTFAAAPLSSIRLEVIERTQVATITSVSPVELATMPLSATQTLTIHGTGFTSTSRLLFTVGNVTSGSQPERLSFVDTTTLTYAAAVGSAVGTWTVTLAEGTGAASFEVVADPASFYTLTPSGGAHGSISPNVPVTKTGGESQTFIAIPQDSTFMVDTWSVDGAVVPGAGNYFTLADVQGSHAVAVTFKAIVTTTPETDDYGDSSVEASPITSGTPVQGFISSPIDVDWFKISATAASVLTFDLTVPAGQDYDLELYGGPDLTFRKGSYGGSGAAESISYNVKDAGTYYVRVYGYPVGNGSFSTTAAYSLTVNVPAPTQFSQQGPKLVATDAGGPYANQGRSVSLSADGNTAIVGGTGDNNSAGATWIWTRNGDVWNQQGAKLVGSGAVGSQVWQGYSVSLSADGNTAIVGGPQDSPSGWFAAGAAWIWVRSGGIWSQQGEKLVGLDAVGPANIGYSVSLSADGNTAIVGGLSDNGGIGAAWVWTRSGGVWTQQGPKLVGSGAVGDQVYQGISVSLSADGNTALVGGHGDNNATGAAWVWKRTGGIWTQQGSKLVGSGAVGFHLQQGFAVSLAADGNTAIVGGPSDNNEIGAAWVWTGSGGVWTQQGPKLVGAGAVGPPVSQGTSVSLSADGDTAIFGGTHDNEGVGAAWIWKRSGGVWTQQGSKLVGSDNVWGSQGTSVALSGNGDTAIVGGANGTGAAWVFTVSTPVVVLPEITMQPAGQTVSVGANVSFTAAANGTPMPTLRWQVSTDSGSSWSDLANNALYSGVITGTLTVSEATLALNGHRYRCVATNSSGSINSAAVVLTVNAAPRPTGTVVAWGGSGYDTGQTYVPAGLDHAVAISAGGYHNLALKEDGTVVAWGAAPINGWLDDTDHGQVTVPPGLTNVIAIAAGGSHSLALKADGTVVAWGSNYAGETIVPPGLTGVTAIAAGGPLSVALKSDGTVVAWGWNGQGQTNVPVGLHGVKAIAARGGETLALKDDGTVVAWGAIGPDTGNVNAVPLGLNGVTSISMGGQHALALKNDSTVIFWGWNPFGTYAPPPDLTGVTAIAAGGYHSVALKADGTVVTWGYGGEGATTVPDGLNGVIAVAGGQAHTIALVGTPPPGSLTITSQPLDQTATMTGSAHFDVLATGTPSPRIRWQRSADGGGTWNWVVDTSNSVAGSISGTLSLTGVSGTMNGQQFRCIVANGVNGSLYSDVVTLNVTKANQSIDFPQPSDRRYGSDPVGLTASATSGLPVAFSVVSGPASVDAGVLTVTGDGTVTVRASQAGDASFNAAPDVDRSFTVAKAELTVTADNRTRAYGAPEPTFTVSYAGFVNNDTAAVLTTAPIASTTAVATSSVGTYAVTPSGGAAANYAFTYVPGTLTVTKAPLTTRADDKTKIAGAANPPLTITYSGFLNAEDAGVIDTAPTVTTTATTDSAVGTYPIALSGGSDNNYALTLQNGTLTVALAVTPVITLQPTNKGVGVDSDVTFTVAATGLRSLTYQWMKDGVNVIDGGRITGSATATLAIASVALTDAGTYSVLVSDAGSNVTSASATLAVVEVQATHGVIGSSYLAGGGVTVANTITYTGTLSGLGWSVLPPAGWSYVAGGGSEGEVRPTAGDTGLLEWAWTTIPASPVTFTYTMNVPAGTTGTQTLAALVLPRQTSTQFQVLVQPDPLTVDRAPTNHSADTNRDGGLSLSELLRVIELYNTRNGTTRTGRYVVLAGTEDGFAADPLTANNATVPLAAHHSGDTNRDGKLGLTELLRVIELYNYRSNTTRTGQYHVLRTGESASEDGFAPGT